MRFPVPAIVSILHRISGFILFLLIPFVLWALHLSLTSRESFDAVATFLAHPLIKFMVWGSIAALLFHLIAGIRHLLMDIHIGEELKSGRMTAWLTLIISFVLIALTGYWLW